jgi:uncharacterized membrane protein HdeD (DUF308 family)
MDAGLRTRAGWRSDPYPKEGPIMALGTGIFLIVVGAILAFAVRDSIDAVDLTMVGYIMLAAGVVAIIVSLIANAQNRKTTHVVDQHVDDNRIDPTV